MKLSMAIRIGSMTSQQVRHTIDDGHNGRCAIGAALSAAGIDTTDDNVRFQWVEISKRIFPLLSRKVLEDSLLTKIIVENDRNGLPRNQIADFVELIENELEAKEVKQETKELAEVK